MARTKAFAWQDVVRVSFLAGPNAALLTLPDFTLFYADTDYELVYAVEEHETLGTDGGTVSLDIKKCTGTQAASAGTSMLLTVFNMKATINTPVIKSRSNAGLAVLQSTRRLKAGERAKVDFIGTNTALTGVHLTAWFLPLRRSSF